MANRESLGQFEFMVLLAVMRLGEDAYGVPIAREIEDTTGRGIAFGSVYFALDRLEEKGLVSSKLGEPTAERGGRAKRYFRVTGRGLRDAKDACRVLVKLWQGLPQIEGGVA
jgi:DNA-binding PadR family transcriptional regulator